MIAARHDRRGNPGQVTEDQFAGVTHRGGYRPMGNVAIRDLQAIVEGVGESTQATAQNHPDARTIHHAPLQVGNCFVFFHSS